MWVGSWGWATVVETCELGPASIPAGNAIYFRSLQVAKTFCLGNPQEFREPGIEQLLE